MPDLEVGNQSEADDRDHQGVVASRELHNGLGGNQRAALRRLVKANVRVAGLDGFYTKVQMQRQ